MRIDGCLTIINKNVKSSDENFAANVQKLNEIIDTERQSLSSEIANTYSQLNFELVAYIERLEQFSSKELQDFAVALQKRMSSLQEKSVDENVADLVQLREKIHAEEKRCVEAIKINTVGLGMGGGPHARLQVDITNSISKLFSGQMKKLEITYGSGQNVTTFIVKRVIEGKTVRLITRKKIAEGSSKNVFLMTVVAGDTMGQLGKTFVYAKYKPDADIEEQRRERGLLQHLRAQDSSINVLEVWNVTSKTSKIKGALSPYCQGELRNLVTEGNKFFLQGPDYLKKVKYAQQIASGVGKCHKLGVILGDIKTENVMLKDDNAILIDFGSAGRKEKPVNLHPTPRYLAPELFEQIGQLVSLTEEQDLWALGITLFELFYGEASFDDIVSGSSGSAEQKSACAQKMRDQILGTLQANHPFTSIIQALLQDDPEQRWKAEKVAEEIQKITSEQKKP
jgi:tRNA A-37 threonylcarbamoyl transferase component Bud32